MSYESGPLFSFVQGQIDHWLINSSDIRFWTKIYSMEVTSGECLSEVQFLLNCPSKITFARGFCGNEAQTFIDFLDRVRAQRAKFRGDNSERQNTGTRMWLPRSQTPAARPTTSFQDLRSTSDYTLFIYSPTGALARRADPLPRRVRRRERWGIPGTHRSHQASQDERRGLQQNFQGIFD